MIEGKERAETEGGETAGGREGRKDSQALDEISLPFFYEKHVQSVLFFFFCGLP